MDRFSGGRAMIANVGATNAFGRVKSFFIFASFYFDAKHRGHGFSNSDKDMIRGMARVLENSGLKTDATIWVRRSL